MQKIDHKINRHVSGLRLSASIACLLNLLSTATQIYFDNSLSDFANRMFPLFFLLFTIGFGACAYYVNEKTYNLCLSVYGLLFVCIAAVNLWLSNYTADIENFIPFPLGRSLDYAFAMPQLLILASATLLRPKITIGLSVLFTLMLFSTILPIINHPKSFWAIGTIALQDEFAMNQPWFIFQCQIFVITAAISILLSWIIEKITTDASSAERTNQQLGRYFSPEIREEIEKLDFKTDTRSGNDQIVAVLFTDIVGFTSICENLKAEEIVELLSEYQKRMVAPIFKNFGTVDKFIGDAVMATFGTPRSRGNDAQNAFECARQMQTAMRQWSKERAEKSLPEIQHRIGIHVGNCIVGNIGSDERIEFSVIGDAVNVASRVCSACKELNTSVLITEDVKLRLSEKIDTEEIRDYTIRGRDESITLHKVII
ncbi:MAG: hypothetical protein CMM49_06020 [Rhodospirillaceae bacterium]|nr:hypothetical protein [Rhodospirillaceae bacterium]